MAEGRCLLPKNSPENTAGRVFHLAGRVFRGIESEVRPEAISGKK